VTDQQIADYLRANGYPEHLVQAGRAGLIDRYRRFVEEVETRLIKPPRHPLRVELGPLDELIESISKVGLLQPIIVRAVDNRFEIVGGNRRLAACRKLGMRKILCHILTLDDKAAFEASLIENIQHETLNPIEEAKAFKGYVEDYGYGGETELAEKIGKSEQYVSARIRILGLPPEIVHKISKLLITPSHAIELVGLDESQQRLVSDLITKKHISTREVRRLVKLKSVPETGESGYLVPWFEAGKNDGGSNGRNERMLGRCLASLRSTMIRFDEVIDGLREEDWLVKEMLVSQRNVIHTQIDQIIRFDMMTRMFERRLVLNRASHLRA
jgi:ParB family chromosome partitioning protein